MPVYCIALLRDVAGEVTVHAILEQGNLDVTGVLRDAVDAVGVIQLREPAALSSFEAVEKGFKGDSIGNDEQVEGHDRYPRV